jgi:hypothetical protein
MDSQLILKRSPIAPDFDYGVLENDVVVGRIFLSPIAPDITQWMWTLGYGHHEDAHRLVATRQRAVLQWPRSPRAGEGNRSALRPYRIRGWYGSP